jgi:hypothetical protein
MISEERRNELCEWARSTFLVVTDEEAEELLNNCRFETAMLYLPIFEEHRAEQEAIAELRREYPEDWESRAAEIPLYEYEIFPENYEELAFVNEVIIHMYQREFGKLKARESYIEIGEKAVRAFPELLKQEKREGFARVCGRLIILRNFGLVCIEGGRSFDLSSAHQARAVIQYLCEQSAFSEKTGKSKHEILSFVKSQCDVCANDWRPAHAFRGKLQSLYEVIDSNKVKGLYWIKPKQ